MRLLSRWMQQADDGVGAAEVRGVGNGEENGEMKRNCFVSYDKDQIREGRS